MTGKAGKGRIVMGVLSEDSGVMHAKPFFPLMFIPSEPQTPSRQERRNVNVSSCALSSIKASNSIRSDPLAI
ncbi:MAG: hypothetical protein ACD_44C00192G0004 [uncultured bacterium]|nr:MAG: hypothetical protein ACD_44C00192G0004 [uncultured bacterium]